MIGIKLSIKHNYFRNINKRNVEKCFALICNNYHNKILFLIKEFLKSIKFIFQTKEKKRQVKFPQRKAAKVMLNHNDTLIKNIFKIERHCQKWASIAISQWRKMYQLYYDMIINIAKSYYELTFQIFGL